MTVLRHVAFENVLLDGFGESRFDDVAHVIDDVIRVTRRRQLIEEHLHLEFADVFERHVLKTGID
jgi:hypothetical protein